MPKKLTTEEFITKAKEIHGDKYDYSKVEYKGANLKVSVICKKHKFEFTPKPANFLNGSNCPICSGNFKYNTQSFIEKAKEIHGNKYDYSKVNYISSKAKVTIICPIHGEFEQQPYSHIKGIGCSKCSGYHKKTTKDFIQEAKEVHGNIYDYSKVKYKNTHTKVTIICPKHGEFKQTPSSHLNGQGCSKCSGLKKLTTKEFIKKAKEIHGDRYDYSKVEYIQNKKPVIIICPEHGEFEQKPNSHLMGSGCLKCKRRSYKYTIKEYIQKAKEIHGDRYDYSKVEYINNKTEIIIICSKHGEFKQIPHYHLSGNGCPKCSGRGFNWLSYKEVKKIVHQQNIKTQEDYYKWWDENKEWCQKMGIPKGVYVYYKKNK